MGETSANHVSDKGLILKIYEEHINSIEKNKYPD